MTSLSIPFLRETRFPVVGFFTYRRRFQTSLPMYNSFLYIQREVRRSLPISFFSTFSAIHRMKPDVVWANRPSVADACRSDKILLSAAP